MKKKILSLLCIMMLIMQVTIIAYGATNEYRFSAIDLIVQVPDTLNVLTQNVSDGNPVLQKLDADATKIRNSYIQQNIYLDLFPDDLSYEIIVKATPINSSNYVDFAHLNSKDFEDYCERMTTKYQENPDDELIDISIYENETTKYVKTNLHNTQNHTSTYIQEYYTVMNGYNYFFRIQSNGVEVSDSLAVEFQSIVDSAQFTEVKASLWESNIFMSLFETFSGFAITFVILGVILFLVTRKPKH